MLIQKQHPIEIQCLFDEQKKLCYPNGVEPVEKMIARNAFFPGGSGLWSTPTDKEWQVLSRLQICRSFFYNDNPVPIMPIREVMVLGQDFGSKCHHEKCLREKAYYDLDCPTWRNLLRLLQEADIQPKDCFFTNTYMGLMEEGLIKKVSSDEKFKECCRSFLAKQIAVQKPIRILALGLKAIELIAGLSCDLAEWKECEKFEELDHSDLGPVAKGVSFNSSQAATVVALVHPSRRSVYVGARRYRKCNRGFTGEDAELAMLKDALRISGLQQS